MKNILFGTLIVTALLIFSQINVFACGCPSMGLPFEQEIRGRLKSGDAVFSGVVVDIVNKAKHRNVVFEVEKFWKGDITARFTVASDKTTSSCAFDFKIGKSYFIFADRWEDKLYTGACSYNRELQNASEYIEILGKGKIPKKITGQ